MRFAILMLYVLSTSLTSAQLTGSKARAMAGCSLTSPDAFVASNSIGASALIAETQLGMFWNNSFLFSEINKVNLSAVQKIKQGSFTYKIDYFGYTNFNISTTGLGYGIPFNKNIGIGIRLNHHRIHIAEAGNKNLFSFDIGMNYNFENKFRLGISIRNPAKQKIDKTSRETLPSEFLIGASYLTNKKLTIAWEFQKDLQLPLRASLGIEYKIHKLLQLRMGVSINPLLIGGGIGLKMKKINLDLSSTWDTKLGYSPQLSLSYVFKKKEAQL